MAAITLITGFNTQPPEGGWVSKHYFQFVLLAFQHTAARRRLGDVAYLYLIGMDVSTHSRPKAAGRQTLQATRCNRVSTHSRPKAAGTINNK